ncbi:hypothetical protein M409DRAFT_17783 [Zasmidium cellare ATCC 36951]|uniref:Uncharacterized protein n=1 Tax=Zasmidium cellare ATCC 36951 TaxID=1080233 RepID=A0A6A6D2Y7_ZASCE|nr:uncharacterized protein M409DRAFT_17783 [Zasmidium cellare ATCC 36951]KAF2172552.1 hypothetical protein M409DRAFT_17783 [Zasmidium cellare ATCC 36951]
MQDAFSHDNSDPVERRRSYGRGGFGNMYTPSQYRDLFVVAPKTDEEGASRRRSSIWSRRSTSTSSSGSFMDKILRRSSKAEEAR